MENPEEKILEAYIAKVLKLQAEHRQVPLQVEELNRIAGELGLSEAELDFIDQKFQGYFYRGKGYLRHRNFDKAIEELSQALLIKPLHIETLFGLAEAHLFRWQQTQKKTDKQAALSYAERCLEIDARHEGAFLLIGKLENKHIIRKKRAYRVRWLMLALITTSILALVSLLVISFYPFKSETEAKLKVENNPQPIKESILEDLNLKASIYQEENTRGLKLYTETSLLKKISEGYAYELTGTITTEKFEIEQLVLQVELKDAQQKTVWVELLTVQEQEQPILVPGDALPLKVLIRNTSLNTDLKEAVIKVYKIKRYPHQKAEEPNRVLTLTWAEGKASDIEFVIAERSQTIRTEPETFNHEIVLSYANKSKKMIKKLQIQIKWLNKELQLIHSQTLDLLQLTDPAMPPNQRRLVQGRFLIPYKFTDYLTYEVEVLRVE